MFEETTQRLSRLRLRLAERVSPSQAIPGTMVSWRTPTGTEYGVVVGLEGVDLLVGVAYDKSLKNDRRVKMYRDESLSAKVAGSGIPGVVMDIHRVPSAKAYMQGRMTGSAMQPYMKMGLGLQKESTDMNSRMYPQHLFEAATDKLNEIRESLQETESLDEGMSPKEALDDHWGTKGRGKFVGVFGKTPHRVAVKKDGSTYYAAAEDAHGMGEVKKARSLAAIKRWMKDSFGIVESLDEKKGEKYRMWTGPTVVKKVAAELKKVDCVSGVIVGTEHVIFRCTKGPREMAKDPQVSTMLKRYLSSSPGTPGGMERMHAGYGASRRTPNLGQDMHVAKESLESLQESLSASRLKSLAGDARSLAQTAKDLGAHLDLAAKNGLDSDRHAELFKSMETLGKPLKRIKKGLGLRENLFTAEEREALESAGE